MAKQTDVNYEWAKIKMVRVSVWIQRKTIWLSKPPPIIEAFPMTYKGNKKTIQWDSDGPQLIVDNGASAYITPYLTDFISRPQPINTKIKGIRGMPKQRIKEPLNGKSRMTRASHITSPCQTLISLPRLSLGSYVLNTSHKLSRTIIPYLWVAER